MGVFWPQFAVSLKPLGDGFIKLIKMIIAPLVFCVVVHGIVGAGDLKKVGRVGLKSLIYFEAVTTIALVLGIILAYTFSPGKGMNVDVSSLDATALTTYTANAEQVTDTVGFLMKIIPTTVFNAFTTGDILQVLLISILFGAGLALMGEKGRSVGNMIEEVGPYSLKSLGLLCVLLRSAFWVRFPLLSDATALRRCNNSGFLYCCFTLACFFVFVVLGAILRMAGFSIISLIKYFREELAVVTGTASSDSVLPQVMRKLEGLGIKDSTVGLVIPTGYSFNLDAFSLYLTLVVVFIAQATNTDLSFGHMLLILGVALLTSKGAHGIPGSAIVVLAATLSAIPDIPMIGLVLVLSVDWFVGIVRALGNLIGNCVATVVIATWEGDIDKEKADRVLAGERDFDTSVVLTEPASTVAVKVNS